MRSGFIFESDQCVNCKACVAACLLENKWSVSGRDVYTYNSEIFPDLPVTHFSLSCNHCNKPLCLDGCPTGAYRRDPQTASVIVDSEKCIGCNYCKWNCPYDAPKLNIKKGYIEKCNFCFPRINIGIEPACSAVCPTGALRFGDVPEISENNILNRLRENDLNPALVLKGSKYKNSLRIFPEMKFNEQVNNPLPLDKNISGEWSLILFSFLAVISVSLNFASLLGGRPVDLISGISILALAGIVSLFHLRIKQKALKSIHNVKSSPLSREIVCFLIYSLVTFTTVSTGNGTLLLVSVVIGFLFLMAIDSVYTFADKSTSLLLHSGQTFLTTLLISSYLLNAVIPFIFIAFLKITFNLFCLTKNKSADTFSTLRIIRVSFLLIISATLIAGMEGNYIVKYIIFLSGEFTDRIIFYADFNPVNINTEISKQLILSQNEKERD
jgi:anaerobic dimethyl sulfoxide reductase subunit B (iron-sulfur subunit)